MIDALFVLSCVVCHTCTHFSPPFVIKDNLMANSTRRLSRIDMQKAMTKVKRFVETRLESDLNLFQVSNNNEAFTKLVV